MNLLPGKTTRPSPRNHNQVTTRSKVTCILPKPLTDVPLERIASNCVPDLPTYRKPKARPPTRGRVQDLSYQYYKLLPDGTRAMALNPPKIPRI